MNGVLLTTAGPKIGLGHMTRCDALCLVLRQQGVDCRLVVECPTGEQWLRERAPQSPYEVTPWTIDRTATASLIGTVDLVVVDAYSIDEAVWCVLRSHCGRLVAFDDVGETPPFEGILINGSPGATAIEYPPLDGLTLLLGPRYQVLRQPFWRSTDRVVSDTVRRIGIVAGGTDHAGVGPQLLSLVESVLPSNADILIIGNPDASVVRARSTGFLTAEELKNVFDGLDVLVSAAGQTLAEAVSCRLPTVAFQTIGNQQQNLVGWVRLGVVLSSGAVRESNWRRRFCTTLAQAMSPQIRRRLVAIAAGLELHESSARVAVAILDSTP